MLVPVVENGLLVEDGLLLELGQMPSFPSSMGDFCPVVTSRGGIWFFFRAISRHWHIILEYGSLS